LSGLDWSRVGQDTTLPVMASIQPPAFPSLALPDQSEAAQS
jgi:hypothetical protein